MERNYWLVARNRHRLLDEMMRLLAGGARISFEGDLRHYTLAKIRGATVTESGPLRRNTIAPRQDFVVVPLEVETIPMIWRALPGRVPWNVIHVLIERDGKLAFAAYDHFDPDGGIVCSTTLPEGFLERLRLERVIDSYAPTPASPGA